MRMGSYKQSQGPRFAQSVEAPLHENFKRLDP